MPRVYTPEMPARFAFDHFSVARPANPAWFLPRAEGLDKALVLQRELPSPTHTFYAVAAMGKIGERPSSHKHFARLVASRRRAPHEAVELSLVEQQVTLQGQWCVRRDSVSQVQRSEKEPELRMIVNGYRCQHPSSPLSTVDFFYSERGLPSEIDPALAAEGEKFLEGVRIDVARDKAAVAH